MDTGKLDEVGEEIFRGFRVVKTESATLVIDALEKVVDLIEPGRVIVTARSPTEAIEINGFWLCSSLSGRGKLGGSIVGDELGEDAGRAVSDEYLAGFGGFVTVVLEEIVILRKGIGEKWTDGRMDRTNFGSFDHLFLVAVSVVHSIGGESTDIVGGFWFQLEGVAAIPLAMAESKVRVFDGGVLRSGPAKAIGCNKRLTTELDGGIHGEATRLHVGDVVEADLREHGEFVFAAGYGMANELEVKGERALVLFDVLEGDTSIEKVRKSGRRLGLKVEFSPFLGFSEKAVIDIAKAEEKRVIRAIDVEVVRGAEITGSAQIDHRDEHTLTRRPDSHRTALVVNVFYVVKIVGVVSGY
jgi:hypothetical protein